MPENIFAGAAAGRQVGEILGAQDDSAFGNVLRFLGRPGFAVRSLLQGDPEGALLNVAQMALDLPTGGFVSRDLSLANLFNPDSSFGILSGVAEAPGADLTTQEQRPEFSDLVSDDPENLPIGERLVLDLVGGVLTDPLTFLGGAGLGRGLAAGAVKGVPRSTAGSLIANALEQTDEGLKLLDEGTLRRLSDIVGDFNQHADDVATVIGQDRAELLRADGTLTRLQAALTDANVPIDRGISPDAQVLRIGGVDFDLAQQGRLWEATGVGSADDARRHFLALAESEAGQIVQRGALSIPKPLDFSKPIDEVFDAMNQALGAEHATGLFRGARRLAAEDLFLRHAGHPSVSALTRENSWRFAEDGIRGLAEKGLILDRRQMYWRIPFTSVEGKINIPGFENFWGNLGRYGTAPGWLRWGFGRAEMALTGENTFAKLIDDSALRLRDWTLATFWDRTKAFASRLPEGLQRQTQAHNYESIAKAREQDTFTRSLFTRGAKETFGQNAMAANLNAEIFGEDAVERAGIHAQQQTQTFTDFLEVDHHLDQYHSTRDIVNGVFPGQFESMDQALSVADGYAVDLRAKFFNMVNGRRLPGPDQFMLFERTNEREFLTLLEGLPQGLREQFTVREAMVGNTLKLLAHPRDARNLDQFLTSLQRIGAPTTSEGRQIFTAVQDGEDAARIGRKLGVDRRAIQTWIARNLQDVQFSELSNLRVNPRDTTAMRQLHDIFSGSPSTGAGPLAADTDSALYNYVKNLQRRGFVDADFVDYDIDEELADAAEAFYGEGPAVALGPRQDPAPLLTAEGLQPITVAQWERFQQLDDGFRVSSIVGSGTAARHSLASQSLIQFAARDLGLPVPTTTPVMGNIGSVWDGDSARRAALETLQSRAQASEAALSRTIAFDDISRFETQEMIKSHHAALEGAEKWGGDELRPDFQFRPNLSADPQHGVILDNQYGTRGPVLDTHATDALDSEAFESHLVMAHRLVDDVQPVVVLPGGAQGLEDQVGREMHALGRWERDAPFGIHTDVDEQLQEVLVRALREDGTPGDTLLRLKGEPVPISRTQPSRQFGNWDPSDPTGGPIDDALSVVAWSDGDAVNGRRFAVTEPMGALNDLVFETGSHADEMGLDLLDEAFRSGNISTVEFMAANPAGVGVRRVAWHKLGEDPAEVRRLIRDYQLRATSEPGSEAWAKAHARLATRLSYTEDSVRATLSEMDTPVVDRIIRETRKGEANLTAWRVDEAALSKHGPLPEDFVGNTFQQREYDFLVETGRVEARPFTLMSVQERGRRAAAARGVASDLNHLFDLSADVSEGAAEQAAKLEARILMRMGVPASTARHLMNAQGTFPIRGTARPPGVRAALSSHDEVQRLMGPRISPDQTASLFNPHAAQAARVRSSPQTIDDLLGSVEVESPNRALINEFHDRVHQDFTSIPRELAGLEVFFQSATANPFYVPHQLAPMLHTLLEESIGNSPMRTELRGLFSGFRIRDVFTRGRRHRLPEFIERAEELLHMSVNRNADAVDQVADVLSEVALRHKIDVTDLNPAEMMIEGDLIVAHRDRMMSHFRTVAKAKTARDARMFRNLMAADAPSRAAQERFLQLPANRQTPAEFRRIVNATPDPNLDPLFRDYIRMQFQPLGMRESFLGKILGGGKFRIPLEGARTAELEAWARKYDKELAIQRELVREGKGAEALKREQFWFKRRVRSIREPNGAARRVVEVDWPGLNYFWKPLLTTIALPFKSGKAIPLNPAYHVRNQISAFFMAMTDPEMSRGARGYLGNAKAVLGAMHDSYFVRMLGKEGWQGEEIADFLRVLSGDPLEAQKAIAKLQGNETLTIGKYSANEVIKTLQSALGKRIPFRVGDEITSISRADLAFRATQMDVYGREVVNNGPAIKRAFNRMVQFGFDMAEASETRFRAQGILSLMERGVTPQDAIRRVEDAFVNYNIQSTTERFIRDVIPFAKWTMGATKWAKNIANRPVLVNWMGRIRPTDDSDYLPERAEDSLAVPLPWRDKEGNKQFLLGLGLPLESTLNILSATTPRGFRRQILGGMQPAIKLPAEAIVNRNFHFGDEFGRFRKAPEFMKLIPGLTTEVPIGDGRVRHEISGNANEIINALPTSRLDGMVDKWMDTRRGPINKLLNTTTGIRTMSVDTEREFKLRIMDYLKDKARSGQVGETLVYFDRLDPQDVPEDLKIVMQALRKIESRKRKQRRQTLGGGFGF